MESVLKKFKEMKEERMRFVQETQSKKSILLSNKFLNTCNKNNISNSQQEYRSNIEDISRQISAIQTFIHSKDNYKEHFEYYISSFFQYFNDKFKELFSSYDFGNQAQDIKMLLDSTEELIDEYCNYNDDNSYSNNSQSNLLNQIKENCCLLDSMLQVNFTVEKEELDKLRVYSAKVREYSLEEQGLNKEYLNERKKYLKSLMRYAKIVVIREDNSISKSVNYNDNYYGEYNNNYPIDPMKREEREAKEFNYDMNIYFNKKESKVNIKKCLRYITKHMIKQYVITYNKESNENSEKDKDINAFNQFIHFKVYGIGKSFSSFIHFLTLLIKRKVMHDSLIKCSIYSSIDYLLTKNLSELSSKTILHHNFNDDYLKQYQ